MASTRIVLAGMPRMLQDIVAGTVRAQPDMVLAALVRGNASELRLAVDKHAVDVIVLGGTDRGLIEVCRDVVTERPLTKVFAVGEGGFDTTLYELRSVVEPLGALGPAELVAAIRTACARGLAWEAR